MDIRSDRHCHLLGDFRRGDSHNGRADDLCHPRRQQRVSSTCEQGRGEEWREVICVATLDVLALLSIKWFETPGPVQRHSPHAPQFSASIWPYEHASHGITLYKNVGMDFK